MEGGAAIDLSTGVDAEVPGMEAPARTLTALDRCERCGAQAYVTTMHGETELLWCAHHFGEHEDKLGPLKVLDDRSMLDS